MRILRKLARNRWSILATSFLILNGYAVYRHCHRPRGPGKVTVELISPEDALVPSHSTSSLKWRFSADMVSGFGIGKWFDDGPVTFSPPVNGSFCWSEADELVFRPDDGWRGCTEFTADFSDGLRSLDSKGLTGPRTFSFSSDPLQLRHVSQTLLADWRKVQLGLRFSDDVSPSQVEAHLDVRTPNGAELAYKIHTRTGGKTLNVMLDRAPTNRLVVIVRAGLQSTSGPLALQSDVRRDVMLTRELRVQHLSPVLGYFGPGSVKIMFNAPVDTSTLGQFISVQPHVKTSVESYYTYRTGHECRLIGNFKAGRNYAITFRKGLKGRTGTALRGEITRTVYFADARPSLQFAASGHYMSPKGGMTVPLRFVNIKHCKVTIKRVYSNNLVQLAARQAGKYSRFYGKAHQGISGTVGELDIALDSERNEIVERNISLRPYLRDKSGVFYLEARGEGGVKSSHYVIVSDTGLTVKRSGKDFLVWANSIRTLDPVRRATVNVLSLENQLLTTGETDANGIARLDFVKGSVEGDPFVVTVEKGDDLTFLWLDGSRVSLKGVVGRRPYLDSGYEAYLFTDRGIYRPGETAHLKAVVRGPGVTCPAAFPIKLNVYRPDGKIERSLNAVLGRYGTADFDIAWADFVPTGKYRLEAAVPGAAEALGQTVVSVEEFVPPTIRAEIGIPGGRVSVGSELAFTVSSEHLFGRPASGLPADARVSFMPHPFKPAKWAGFAFGNPQRKFRTIERSLGKRRLGASGKAVFRVMPSARWRPPAAIKALVVGTVTEMSGRGVTAYGSGVMDVYPFYIGIRRPVTGLRTGKPHVFEIVVVSPAGEQEGGATRLETRVDKISWGSVLKRRNGRYTYCSEEQAVPVMENKIEPDAGLGSVRFTPAHAGRFRFTVVEPVSQSSSSLDFSVGTAGQTWTSRSMEAPDVVELELDKKEYRAGETAALVIRSPFTGKALVTIESDRVLSHQVLEMTNNTAEIRLPVLRGYEPNVYCSVSVIRPALYEKTWGRHRAAGRVPIVVDASSRKLTVKMELPPEIRPRTELKIPVFVTDAAGTGREAEVVVAAVDEGICALTAFPSPDPHAYFLGPRLPGVQLHDLYAQLMPEVKYRILGAPSAPGGGGKLPGLAKRLNPVKARRFKPVALWSSGVTTDEQGRGMVRLRVPEFTGRLRVMAVAVNESCCGGAARGLAVKRRLIVRSSLPRFVAPSDSFTMPVRVFNETGRDGRARVVMSCSGPLSCEEGKASVTNSVFVAAGKATNVNIRLDALSVPGNAGCRLTVAMGGELYEEDVEISVRPPASLATFHGSGMVAPAKDAELAMPVQWLEGTGNTEIWLSPMPGIKLGGSINYLMRYPYGCLEQTTSKSLPLLYLAELVERTYPGWLDRNAIADFVSAGIHRLLSMQRTDGGFGLWPGGSTYKWGSVYASHFLVEAKAAGYGVPDGRLDDALKYLEKFTSSRTNPEATANPGGELYNRSYACFVLALAKRPQHGSVARLLEQKDKLDRGTQINLGAALVAAGRRRDGLEFLGSIGATPSVARLREIGGSLRSDVRNDALLLSSLLELDPGHEFVPLLAKRLEAGQTNGRWPTTQDNAMVLMALGKYCDALSVGSKLISGRVSWDVGKPSEFKDKTEFHVAMEGCAATAARIMNTGTGPIYYYWKSEGVPADGEVKESDKGVTVRRTLCDTEGNAVDPLGLEQGDLLIVKTTVSSSGSLDNMAIEDLLPAGLEIENARLKTSRVVSWIRGKQTLPVNHTDARDDRMIAFTGAFRGEKSYYYAVRAVTVGDFVMPAVSASCMYDSSIRSVHGRGRIRVIGANRTARGRGMRGLGRPRYR